MVLTETEWAIQFDDGSIEEQTSESYARTELGACIKTAESHEDAEIREAYAGARLVKRTREITNWTGWTDA